MHEPTVPLCKTTSQLSDIHILLIHKHRDLSVSGTLLIFASLKRLVKIFLLVLVSKTFLIPPLPPAFPAASQSWARHRSTGTAKNRFSDVLAVGTKRISAFLVSTLVQESPQLEILSLQRTRVETPGLTFHIYVPPVCHWILR